MKRLDLLIGGSLRGLRDRRGRALELQAQWSVIAGPEMAARSAVHWDGDRVVVTVEDEAWVRGVRSVSQVLTERLAKELGTVSSLVVVLGRLPQRSSRGLPTAASPPARATPPAPATCSPSIERAALAIRDPVLRARVRAVATVYLDARRRRSDDGRDEGRDEGRDGG